MNKQGESLDGERRHRDLRLRPEFLSSRLGKKMETGSKFGLKMKRVAGFCEVADH